MTALDAAKLAVQSLMVSGAPRSIGPATLQTLLVAIIDAVVADRAPGRISTEVEAPLSGDTLADVLTNLAEHLATLAPIDSPELTGTPTAPTPDPGTDTVQIATTAFVQALVAGMEVARLDVAQSWSRPQTAAPSPLTHNTAWDGQIIQHATVAVDGASFTIANPSAQTDGAIYMIYISYTTSHSIAWGSAFKGSLANITPTATAGAKDIFTFRSNGTNLELVGYKLNAGAD